MSCHVVLSHVMSWYLYMWTHRKAGLEFRIFPLQLGSIFSEHLTGAHSSRVQHTWTSYIPWANLVRPKFLNDVLSVVLTRFGRRNSSLRPCVDPYSQAYLPKYLISPLLIATIRLERELEESGVAEDGEVKVEVLDGGPDKTGGGILVAMAKAGEPRVT